MTAGNGALQARTAKGSNESAAISPLGGPQGGSTINAMIGFDVDAATLTLYREALAAGATGDDIAGPDSPRDVAEAHLHTSRDRCSRSPCRTAGLCHALYELVQYRAEAKDAEGLISAAQATEEMRKALQKCGDLYAPTVERLLERSIAHHGLDRDLGPREARSEHEILCVRPAQVLTQMMTLLMNLERFEGELRGRMWSFELQQSSDKRPGDLLLTAVYQHLRWGRLTYKEIATLVPDMVGVRGAEERVRARVKSDNARSLMPIELYEESVQRAAEKRSKQSPST